MQHILRRSLLRGDDCRCFGWKIRLLRTHVGGSCSGGYAEKHVEPLFFEVNEDGRIYGRSVYVNTHTMYRLHMQINANNGSPCTLLNHEHPTHGSLLVSPIRRHWTGHAGDTSAWLEGFDWARTSLCSRLVLFAGIWGWSKPMD